MRGVYRERRVQCGLHQGRDHEPGGVVLRHCNVRGRADGDRLASDADVRRGIARHLLSRVGALVPAGFFYAIATFVAVRTVIDSLPTRTFAAASLATCFLVVVAALWTFRAVGVHYQLRYQAFTARNDWVEVLRPDKHDEWPDN